LSLTTASGLPRIATILSSSRATLAPDSDVSGTSASDLPLNFHPAVT
jgi:hypothetical protein